MDLPVAEAPHTPEAEKPVNAMRGSSPAGQGMPLGARGIHRWMLWGVALVWFAGLLAFVWRRWWNFGFSTFDLAFYLQSLWGFCNGVWNVTLLDVPMLGNHADWIVMLLTPIYAVWPHAMVPVIAQIAVVALAAPLGYRIARGAGLDATAALLMGLALLLTPATALAATHEFHPETLTITFLLGVYYGEQRRSLPIFWLSLIGVLACKENMALLLPFWFAIRAWQRRVDAGERWRDLAIWYIPAFLGGVAYFLGYEMFLRPLWNPGKVDFWNLYAELGTSPGDALRNLVTRPMVWISVAWRGFLEGNLVWALLGPLLLLPLLRPTWFLIAGPLLAQHLLSWRPSEWVIGTHYAAPLVPIFWLAAVEVLGRSQHQQGLLFSAPLLRLRWSLPPAHAQGAVTWATRAILVVCIGFTFWVGLPVDQLTESEALPPAIGRLGTETRHTLLRQIKPQDAIAVPMPYQSHLANRPELHSTHRLIMGLYTLSNTRWTPPDHLDVVIVDYAEPATFNKQFGLYHMRLFGRDGTYLPSSDELFSSYMSSHAWENLQINEFAIWRRAEEPPPAQRPPDGSPEGPPASLGTMGQREILGIGLSSRRLERDSPSVITFHWNILPLEAGAEQETIIPWAELRMTPVDAPASGLGADSEAMRVIVKGWCLPHLKAPPAGEPAIFSVDPWRVLAPPNIPGGMYHAKLLVQDRRAAAFPGHIKNPQQGMSPVAIEIDLGRLEIAQ